MGSSRRPGKSLADVSGAPLITRIIQRMLASDRLDEVILASPDTPDDRPLLDAGRDAGAIPFAGSEEDVLDRLYQAAKSRNADVIVHIGGDCPFCDTDLMARALDLLATSDAEFVSNLHPMTYPAGLDVDAMTFGALERCWQRATLKTTRIHCLSYIHQNPDEFRTTNFEHDVNLGHLRWTLDYPEDLEMVRRVFEALGPDGSYFGMQEILAFLDANPDIAALNSHLSDFVPDQPAHWDSEGYLSDLRDDIASLIGEAGRQDAARDYGTAAATYSRAREMLDELVRRAETFADRHPAGGNRSGGH
jgi:spore coat polysaccharide biosynthesis protein SpsF